MSIPKTRVFDCIVIGGGSGGLAFSVRAAGFGKKVALVEANNLGGTCVNVGCVPKKVMWYAASTFETLPHLHHLGITFPSAPKLSFSDLVNNRETYIRRLNGIYAQKMKSAQVEVFNGWGRFVRTPEGGSLKTVKVERQGEDAELLQAEHVLIATGSKSTPLKVEGGDLCLDSDGFFALKELPKKAAIIGAGYIAVELAGVLAGLGTETHLFVRGENALRKFDSMIQKQAHENLLKSGVKVHPCSFPDRVAKSAISGMHSLALRGGAEHGDFDVIINAIGRVPLCQDLGLEEVGVALCPDMAAIRVDEWQNTSISGIFALGDVSGHVQLTPVAIAAARRLADRLYGGFPSARLDYSLVPTVVFAHPPIATVGLTEAEAKETYGEEDVQVFEGTSVNCIYGPFQIPPEEKPKTFVKVVCRKSRKNKILGLHVVGKGADELMQGFAVAIKMGATKADLDNCVAIHPTAAEEVVTLAPWGFDNYASS